MILQRLAQTDLALFLDFCKRYRDMVDDSYLTDDELALFVVDMVKFPTVIVKDGLAIVAAASLIVDAENRVARFRIFHSEASEDSLYREMLEAVLAGCAVDAVSIYGDHDRVDFFMRLARLQFEFERFIFVMRREIDGSQVPVRLPIGYRLRPMQFDQDEVIYQQVRNTAFAGLAGSMPLSLEAVAQLPDQHEHLDNGILLLCREMAVVGLVRVTKYEEGGKVTTAIEPICILPDYQGQGLGRHLLRAGLNISAAHGISTCTLCVNADNKRAALLYEQEGFTFEHIVQCWRYAP